MTSKGPVEREDGKVEQVELPFFPREKGDSPRGEIAKVVMDNLQAKKEMARALTTMGFSHEAAARLLRLNPEGGGKEEN